MGVDYNDLFLLIALLAGAVAATVFIVKYVLAGNENDRAKRETMGFCFHCGYDMRATPDRCPECGRERRSGAVGAAAGKP